MKYNISVKITHTENGQRVNRFETFQRETANKSHVSTLISEAVKSARQLAEKEGLKNARVRAHSINPV